jgi:carboxyl-terminal processing protease
VQKVLSGVVRAVPGDVHLVSDADRKGIEGFAQNRYVGTGVQVGYDAAEKLAFIISPIRNGPAHKAGALPGDRILKIDGENVHGVGLKRVVECLRGDEGTAVTLTVRQPGSNENRDLKLIRGVSPIETVVGFCRLANDRWRFRPENDTPIGYVAVTNVNASTLHELRVIERELTADGVQGLVLDMRFAQGGDAHQATLLADGLLDEGTLWQMRDARQNVRVYKSDRECLFRGWPLIVLVDQHTGPAAAWVAGTLQDNNRAPLLGQTFIRDGYTKRFVNVSGGNGALEIPVGLVERTKTQTVADHGLSTDRYAAGGWVIQPKHAVGATSQQRQALHQWTLDKLKTDTPNNAHTTSPSDEQLAKAMDLLRKQIAEIGKREQAEENP